MVDLSTLRETNALQADKALVSTKHQEVLAHTDNVAQTVLSATTALIQYLEGHTTKTEVINQLDSISTPDVKYVVEALQVLDQTIKATPQVDLSQLTELMQGVLDEAKQIPKTLPELKDQPFVDYSNQFKNLTDAIQAVEKVVKNQKLVAEAPVVNVPEIKLPQPQVHVDAPDLKSLQQGFKDVVTAVKKIAIPEYKTDNSEVEKLLKKSNTLLDKLLKKPVSGGGGGGGRATPYQDTTGTPQFIETISGVIPVTAGALSERYDYSNSSLIYTAVAPVGTADSDTVWTITKYDLSSSSSATGKIARNTAWNNRASGTYA